ncbi:3-keto-5-aminohexanoate cleavage protein [Paracoccus sp. SCSIO 75233]|uniref:3-keto-5-aminohexanoate cleavage protein n=1 Tax=Paracoccus sp. SCSIO 75233 TaxID=3017782 RepID=UPI0022F092F1|nr:3-keto-5-aminohexanoate cleavage protein [Paracoccus sp. SCSIO 75233]WBU51894.1 3-keto-5-aminohexanoate cleavage protein [Paracoccus sp. SCSIO 75233]
MTRPVILTACINGGRPDAASINSSLPISPSAIAAAAKDAARLGAAVLHIHARNPSTGVPCNSPEIWAEIVRLIREDETDILLNLSASMDGFLYLDDSRSFQFSSKSTLRPPAGRAAHILTERPEIGTIDFGTFAIDEAIHVARPSDLREMARLYSEAGIVAEVECFDFGHLETARKLIEEGCFPDRPFVQLCLGTAYGGAPATHSAFSAMRERIPAGLAWAAFAAGDDNIWVMRETVIGGGHVRAGLEDCLTDGNGSPVSNGELLKTAVKTISEAGGRPATPAEARAILGIKKIN